MSPPRALSQAEFIALVAMLTGSVAFSIDAILPGLPAIATEFDASDATDLDFIILGFVVGLGLSTFVVGPLSDAFGRKPVMLGGAALFILSALAATWMPTLEGVVTARVLQGVGAAAPRVVAIALIRDLYSGRGMARVLSLVMMVFAMIPALAPMMGAGIIVLAGWRGVFWAFALFSLTTAFWLALRQPETLPPEHRRPLRLGKLWSALREVVGRSEVRRTVATQALVFGMLFSTLIAIQPIFDLGFGRGASFVYWFGAIAVVSAGGSMLNAWLVGRFGMLWLLRRALAAQLVLSGLALGYFALGPSAGQFWVFLVFVVGAFTTLGLTLGNLNALALQPMGHIAGMAASTVTALATLGGTALAALGGLFLTASPLPLIAIATAQLGAAFALALTISDESGAED